MTSCIDFAFTSYFIFKFDLNWFSMETYFFNHKKIIKIPFGRKINGNLFLKITQKKHKKNIWSENQWKLFQKSENFLLRNPDLASRLSREDSHVLFLHVNELEKTFSGSETFSAALCHQRPAMTFSSSQWLRSIYI